MWALIVENDDRMARALSRSMRAEGFDVERVTGVASTRVAVAQRQYDVALVDLGLDDGDGVDVIRMLRDHPSTGVIAVTARGAVSDRVRGLRAGADDYLVKPFGIAELTARVDAVLRRIGPTLPEPKGVITHGPLAIDRECREVTSGGEPITLTRKEFDVLVLLAQRAGSVVERDRILTSVWQSTWEGATRSLDTHMASLRTKLGAAASITTVRGVGYRLESLSVEA
ncbi:DNA-binding response regulator, OmpR family, contains REC and winged-helix (wHTH) domain [Rhodococcoides kyotonense]|uniref:Sensory transduction protein RegX3 n=2 Tax=Rhodococcoides kyotonense TaxID=398843 RepID=A0A239EBH4_9NOCA|nr:DNA-binding response regulator, OmpR family, contains REC and winged-helix (wHTH) domain [Rhodococcus kyotonensis]